MDTPDAHPSGRALATLANEARAAREASLDLLLPNGTFPADRSRPRPCNRGYLRHVETGTITALGCWSWLCPRCAPKLRAGVRRVITEGADLVPDDRALALFTFTEGAFATLDLPALRVRFKETVKRLRRRFDVGEYAAAIEFQKRGAMHPHVVASVPLDLVPSLRSWSADRKRDRRQYRWHFGELVPFARELGWGQMVDAVAIEDPRGAGRYVSKQLASYVTKEAHDRFKGKGATRVRPFRQSAGWHPQTLQELRRPADRLGGTWEVVQPLRCC